MIVLTLYFLSPLQDIHGSGTMFIEAGKPEFNRRIAVCIGVIALCIVAAFMPFIVDGFTAIAGTGVDLGTVAK